MRENCYHVGFQDISPSRRAAGGCKGGSSGGRCPGCPRALAVTSTMTGDAQWAYPQSLTELCAIIKATPAGQKLKMVRGNTATGEGTERNSASLVTKRVSSNRESLCIW